MNEREAIREHHERLAKGHRMLNKARSWNYNEVFEWDQAWSLEDGGIKPVSLIKKILDMRVGDELFLTGKNQVIRKTAANAGKKNGAKYRTRKVGRKKYGRADNDGDAETIVTRVE